MNQTNNAVLLEPTETQSDMPLSDYVMQRLHYYFEHLEGEMPNNLYDMVMKEVEKGFFKVVMQKARGNQCLAAKMCGIARGTLRKKLKACQLD